MVDPDGRFIFLEVLINDKEILIGNIYAPNEDTPNFFENIQNHLISANMPSIILAGDFNLVMDNILDTFNYQRENNTLARKQLVQLMNTLDLEDIFRVLHPNKKVFTWSRRNPTKMARLDFFQVLPDISNLCPKVDCQFGYRTDHSLVYLEVEFTKNSKGKGYWKFNSSLLHDKEYVSEVKRTIKDTVNQYRINDEDFSIDNRLLWEMIKLSIRGISIQYSPRKKRQNVNIELVLTQSIQRLEENTDSLSFRRKKKKMIKEDFRT